MLSLAAISILLASVVAIPSTFILYAEEAPPISFTELSKSFCLFSLMILNCWVMEPVVGKTVSYLMVSAEIVTAASGELMNESFLQENRRIMERIRSRPAVFMR